MRKVHTLADIKSYVAEGVSTADALKGVLKLRGYTIESFAEHFGIRAADVSRCFNGKEVPTPKLLATLIDLFDGDEFSWRMLLHEAGRPVEPRRQAVGQ